jgi:hypothetical protein
MSYEVGSSVTVRALHQMPVEGPEGELHAHDYLEEIRPPEAEAVTVEVLARWAHAELVPALRQAGGDTLGVRVWESEADFGGYSGPVA